MINKRAELNVNFKEGSSFERAFSLFLMEIKSNLCTTITPGTQKYWLLFIGGCMLFKKSFML